MFKMLSHVKICFNPIHNSISQSGSLNIKNVDPSKKASKIIRAVLREFSLDPNDSFLYQLGKCNCQSTSSSNEVIFDNEKTIQELGWVEGERLSIFFKGSEVGDRQEQRAESMRE